MSAPVKTIIFTAVKPEFEVLAYHDQWTKAWMESPLIRPSLLNLSRKLSWSDCRSILQADLVVFLHSTNSNEFIIPTRLRKLLRFSRAEKLIFVGNEYKFMREKIELIDELRIDLICSQLPDTAARWVYAPCRRAEVANITHALDADRYRPLIPLKDRPLDIGVRAFEYPWYLGDRDRAEIIETFMRSPRLRELRTDISMDPLRRFTGEGWASFLNSCRATISTEAGSSFIQRDDSIRTQVNAFQEAHPHAPYAEVFDRFFKNGVPNSIRGKAISSRHFEAIGTRTAQIMFPGEFNGMLLPDVHYIALNRDYSNLDSVIERLKDDTYLEKMTQETLEHCLAHHQFKHRIEKALRLAFRR